MRILFSFCRNCALSCRGEPHAAAPCSSPSRVLPCPEAVSYPHLIPLASFAGQPSSSIGVAFLKSYAAICLECWVIVLACVIFSAFASSPPAIADDTLAAATIVWNYVGELIFNMLVLVGAIKMSDRIIRELMGVLSGEFPRMVITNLSDASAGCLGHA